MITLTTYLTITMSGKTPVYTYDPTSQTVTGLTTLVYELDSATIKAGWVITGLTVTNDPQNQASAPTEAADKDSISIVDICTKAETFDVTVSAANPTLGHTVRIDPQVQNIPPE